MFKYKAWRYVWDGWPHQRSSQVKYKSEQKLSKPRQAQQAKAAQQHHQRSNPLNRKYDTTCVIKITFFKHNKLRSSSLIMITVFISYIMERTPLPLVTSLKYQSYKPAIHIWKTSGWYNAAIVIHTILSIKTISPHQTLSTTPPMLLPPYPSRKRKEDSWFIFHLVLAGGV